MAYHDYISADDLRAARERDARELIQVIHNTIPNPMKNCKLVSDKTLSAYIAQFADTSAAKRSITVYSDAMGNLSHLEGSHFYNTEAADSRLTIGVFHFYNEYAPYTKTEILAMVRHQRQNARD